ncbi:hypothetical protein P7C73_g462, partial [Tremellales sp. Uapishka_1]
MSEDAGSYQAADTTKLKRKIGPVQRGRAACTECRDHKIRCHPHESSPATLPCARCLRMNLVCEFKQHHRGRKKKIPIEATWSTTAPSTNEPVAGPSTFYPGPPAPPPIEKNSMVFGSSRYPFMSTDPSNKDTSMSLRHMVGSGEHEEEDEVEAPVLPATRGQSLVGDPVSCGHIDMDDAHELFDLTDLAYPESVQANSPFLFTAIMCITSRYLSTQSRISPDSILSVHQQILVLARDHLTWAFADATSSLEVVQAITLLSLWKEPDDDKAGFYFNRAVVLARELELGAVVPAAMVDAMSFGEKRELRSKQRLCQHWLKRAPPGTLLLDTVLCFSVELRRKYLIYRDILQPPDMLAPPPSGLSLVVMTRTVNLDWNLMTEAWMEDIEREKPSQASPVVGRSSTCAEPHDSPAHGSRAPLRSSDCHVRPRLSSLPECGDDCDDRIGEPGTNPVDLRFGYATTFRPLRRDLLVTIDGYDLNPVSECERLIMAVVEAFEHASVYPTDSPSLHARYLRRLCNKVQPIRLAEVTNDLPIPTMDPLSMQNIDFGLDLEALFSGFSWQI